MKFGKKILNCKKKKNEVFSYKNEIDAMSWI